VRFFLIFFICIFLFADDYYDKNSSSVTKYDLELMQEFDKLVYELSDKEPKSLDINAIYKFIKIHKKYITDYSLAKVNLTASTGIDSSYTNDSDRKREYSKVGIQLTYPIFDPKSNKDMQNKKLEYNFKILDEIKQYVKLRNQLIAKQRELKFNRLIQIKQKLQVKKAVIYLNEKLKTIEQILNLQNDILDIKSNLQISKTTLLNYVKDSYKKQLEELLK